VSLDPSIHGLSNREEMVPFIPRSATTVLDVGCSRGLFVKSLLAARPELRITGIEVDANAAESAATHYASVIRGCFPDDVPSGTTYDCLVFNDVLEHIVDPWTALRGSTSHLADGGVAVASIPNVRYVAVVLRLLLQGRFDYVDFGILDRSHLRFFTRSSIDALVSTTGFVVETIEPINASQRWWAFIAIGPFKDMRYLQFSVVAHPRT